MKGDGASVLCIDLAGHGKSSHRESRTYLLTDYVVDLYRVVQALGWNRFGLLAHSLGGSVACLFAGSWPDFVSELILIESLGPWTNPPDQAPANLRNSVDKVRFVPHLLGNTSLVKEQQVKRRKVIFKSIEDAAKRRSQGNVVNKLPIDAARTLCSRGLVKSGEGFVWASYVVTHFTHSLNSHTHTHTHACISDSALTDKSRFRLSDSHVRAFLSRIRAPTLLVMASNGMLEKVYSRFLVSPFSLLGRLLLRLALFFTSLYVNLFKSQDAKARARLAGLRWVVNFVSRPSALCSTNFMLSEIEVGGHHPHLTRADVVCREVSLWRAANLSSTSYSKEEKSKATRIPKKRSSSSNGNSITRSSNKVDTSGEWEFVKKASNEKKGIR